MVNASRYIDVPQDGKAPSNHCMRRYPVLTMRTGTLKAVSYTPLNEPWQVLEYCAGLGEIFDIVVEDMDRQARVLKG